MRSIREYAQRPISGRQLGEFLYRVGRVADYGSTNTHTPQGSITTEHASRPYPAGGLRSMSSNYTSRSTPAKTWPPACTITIPTAIA